MNNNRVSLSFPFLFKGIKDGLMLQYNLIRNKTDVISSIFLVIDGREGEVIHILYQCVCCRDVPTFVQGLKCRVTDDTFEPYK